MEAPNIKEVGLNIAEDAVMSVLNSIVKPYAEYYVAQIKLGGVDVGPIVMPLVSQLLDMAKKEVDKIDGVEG